jgi:hypothetical protein
MTKNKRPEPDLDADAQAALDEARAMPQGRERTAAMKKAGLLRLPIHAESFMQGAGDPREPSGGCRQRVE